MRERLLTTDYLVGFVDGEGCFQIDKMKGGPGTRHYSFALSVTQRADGAEVLSAARQVFGGSVSLDRRVAEKAAGQVNANPRVHWHVASRDGLLKLVAYFDAHPPIVKAVEYEIWRRGITAYYSESWRRSRWQAIPEHVALEVQACREELMEAKRFRVQRALIGPTARQLRPQMALALGMESTASATEAMENARTKNDRA